MVDGSCVYIINRQFALHVSGIIAQVCTIFECKKKIKALTSLFCLYISLHVHIRTFRTTLGLLR